MSVKEEFIRKNCSGSSEAFAERFWAAVEAGDKYDECPFAKTGFKLLDLPELPTVVIGPDGKCVCTKEKRCLNVDRHDGNRCSVDDLRKLSNEASSRRAYQSGNDW